MVGIALTPEQEKLKQSIEQILDRLLRWEEFGQEEIESWLDQLADQAFLLHEQLQAEGQVPQYPVHVLAKRGMRPTSKEFYRNMYAAESLLQFLQKGSP